MASFQLRVFHTHVHARKSWNLPKLYICRNYLNKYTLWGCLHEPHISSLARVGSLPKQHSNGFLQLIYFITKPKIIFSQENFQTITSRQLNIVLQLNILIKTNIKKLCLTRIGRLFQRNFCNIVMSNENSHQSSVSHS